MKILVLGCSARKTPGGPKPAIELYDGPSFRIVRKYIVRARVFILSAEAGLITAESLMYQYDRVMDRSRAQHLAPRVRELFAEAVENLKPTEVFCHMGSVYRECLGNQYGVPMRFAEGAQGVKLGHLRDWILGET